MSKLIALVATAVSLGGVRTIIQPGQELPDLSAHDARELLASGAAQDPVAKANQDRVRESDVAAAERDFDAARKAVQARVKSTAKPEPDAGGATTASSTPTTPTATASKAAARK